MCRAEGAERHLAAAQESLTESRQNLASLQTHLERAELQGQGSAAEAVELGAKVKELSADKDALVTELVKANKTAAHMKQDFKCIVKCLKGSDPLHSITDFLEEADDGADSGRKACSSELTWVMKRLSDHFKQSSGAVSLLCASMFMLLHWHHYVACCQQVESLLKSVTAGLSAACLQSRGSLLTIGTTELSNCALQLA